MEFDTKIAVVVCDDLAVWQKLNVTAFLTSGIVGQDGSLIGQEYTDASDNRYAPMLVQPVIILTCDRSKLKTIYSRGMDRGVGFCLYIEDMFATGYDAANRETVRTWKPEELPIVGLALREHRKLVDKIVKGAKMHP
ncbi:MAG: hypothetical protein CMM58_11125 [Rhodospirillaceae bacterium]|nr:hypothetical protein [Rhodospirillaceae bacterium]|tara:strand:+ start:4204 stop:4614 length:411 start_codon:yes stop_codon:yes gene_type:complete